METPDWKVVVALAVAGLAVVAAFFAVSPDSNISGFFTAGAQNGNVSFTATLFETPFSVSVQSTRLTLALPKFSEGLAISGQKLDLSAFDEVEVVLVDWNGKVELSEGGELALSGTAKKVLVNNIGLSQDAKSQSILGKDITFNSAKFGKVSLQSLKIEKVVGTVNLADGKNSIKLDNEPLELLTFEGEINIKDGIVISGSATKVSVAGENTISVQ